MRMILGLLAVMFFTVVVEAVEDNVTDEIVYQIDIEPLVYPDGTVLELEEVGQGGLDATLSTESVCKNLYEAWMYVSEAEGITHSRNGLIYFEFDDAVAVARRGYLTGEHPTPLVFETHLFP